jgi:hypothetical protein
LAWQRKKKREKRLEKASKEFDVSSPYEDYSNMLNNFNTDSDLMQTLFPSQPDLVQNLNFSGDRAVTNQSLVNLRQSTGQNASGTMGKLKSFI